MHFTSTPMLHDMNIHSEDVMTAEMLKSPYHHPSAWTGAQMRESRDWIVRLDDAQNHELAAALAFAKQRGARIPQLSAEDFPLPTLQAALLALRAEVNDGRGFVLLKGFDIDRYTLEDTALVYWGIGAHLGTGRAQNAQGDLLGHVTDLGVDHRTDPNARGYQTRNLLRFHNDAMDIVALLCIRPARAGGLSRIVSSTAIHNAMLERRPDLLRVMYEPFHMDRRGEVPQGKTPWHVGPFFNLLDGRLFCGYNRAYVESAQRFEEVPRLTRQQIETLDMVNALCADPEFHLDMAFERGDMQFISNYTTLHSRTEYEDWPEKERRRYLLRLWLDTHHFAQLPASIAERQKDMRLWQQHPKPPIFDLSAVHAELAH